MTGLELKAKLIETRYSMAEIARKLGIKSQDLNALFNVKDTKTGTVERLAAALELPIAYFYGESFSNISSVSGNNNATATGNNNTVSSSDDRLLTLLLNKDEQLLLAMKQTSKAQEQTDVVLKMLTGK
jgi:transcriptional regulator with XRE-family HTH domain